MNTRETATRLESADRGRIVEPVPEDEPEDEPENDADWDDPGPDDELEDLELIETDAYLAELFDVALLDEEEQEREDEAEMAFLQEMGIDLDEPNALDPSMERPPLAGMEALPPEDEVDEFAVGPEAWWAGSPVGSADGLPLWVFSSEPGREADEALGG